MGLCLSLVSFLYLSFHTCLEEGIAPSSFRLMCSKGGRMGSGFEGFEFSHERVKQVFGLFIVLFTP